jgi:hypothetical protein
MFTMPLIELAGLLIVVLFISAGVVLWMKSRKKKPNPMVQLLILVLLLVLCFAGLKWGGEALGILPGNKGEAKNNPYVQALILLQEPYPAYTSLNNLASANRETLVTRFQKMEQLELAELKIQVSSMRAMIESAPATGQTGIYNMRMTSDIQARWEELRLALKKRAERPS